MGCPRLDPRAGRSVYIIARGVGELHGPAAARKMRELGGDPPHAFYLDPIGEDER